MMPEQKPGKSEQDVSTPDNFIEAFVKRFGIITWDLAADSSNSKGLSHFDKEHDSLSQNWSTLPGNLWLNPPYEKIGPWAAKCAMESREGAKIFMLVPASVGSNWYLDYVHRHAYVLALNPRLKFVGHKTAYPKDLILCCYQNHLSGFNVWRWK
jgi:phage N-6-adenine-methyltransferase